MAYLVTQSVISPNKVSYLLYTKTFMDLAEARKNYDKVRKPRKRRAHYFMDETFSTKLLMVHCGYPNKGMETELLDEDIYSPKEKC
jgi:hypothetical protein